MTEGPLSQSRLSTYTKCQRKHEFDYDWEVEAPDERQRYLTRGIVLHSAIEYVCELARAVPGLSDEAIRACAIGRLIRDWHAEMDRSEYYSEAEFVEGKLAARARIEAFFDGGPGYEHVRNSLAAEKHVSFEHDGTEYQGYVDNVVASDDGLVLVDYKSGSIKPPFSREWVGGHPEDYRPKRVKPAMQAALYLEGIKETDLYEEGMDLEFVFYELKKDRSKEVERRPGSVSVTLEGYARPVADGYESQKADVWELIEAATEGIRAGEYGAEPFADIYDETCPSCEYRSICPEYLEEEVTRP